MNHLFKKISSLVALTLLLSSVLLSSGCSMQSYKDISVKDIQIQHVRMQGSQLLLDFSATVNNPGSRSFVLSKANGSLNRGTQIFATAQQLQDIVIAPKSEQSYSGSLSLTINDMLSLLTMGTDYKSWNLDSFVFNGDMQVRSSMFKKKLKFENVPLKQLINSLER